MVLADAFGTQYSTVAFGDLWLAGDDHVIRVDPETRRVEAEITIPAPPNASGSTDVQSAVEYDGRIWVASNAAGLFVIDPSTNTVVDEPSIDIAPYAMAVEGDLLWITDFEGSKVARYDPATETVEASLDVSDPTGVAVADGMVFVARHRSDRVVRIDASTARTVDSYEVRTRPENVIVAAGAVWAAVNSGASVVRIAASGEATRLPLGVNVIAVGASSDGAGPVWASVGPLEGCDGERSSVVRLDPASMSVTGRVVVPCAAFVTQIGGDVWVVDDITGTLYVASVEA